MSSRRPILALGLLVAALAACATTVTPTPRPANIPAVATASTAPAPLTISDFAGTWRETWGVGEETDVDYQDVYVLTLEGGYLSATCPDKPNYEFAPVAIDGPRLRVQLNNPTDGEPFLIDYDLTMSGDRTALDGTAVTTRGVTRTIRWDRIE